MVEKSIRVALRFGVEETHNNQKMMMTTTQEQVQHDANNGLPTIKTRN